MALASMLLAEDIQLQEITLDEFLTEFLPDYKIKKQIQLEGEVINYDVAKETGDIVIITEKTENKYTVYFFDKNGNELWKKDFFEWIDCEISDLGDIIIIEDKNNNKIYDKHGQLYSSKKMIRTSLLPSPNGTYFYKKTGMMDGKQKEMIIYDRELNKHKLDSPELENIRSMRYRFVADNRILAVIDGWIKIFSFNNYEIELLNKIELNRDRSWGEFYGGFHYRKTDYSEEYFGIVVYEDGLYVFDVNGNLVYRDETKYVEIKFTNNENLIVSSYGVQKKIRLINLKTNKKTNLDFSFEWSNKGFHFIGFLDNCSKINEIVFCNVITGIPQEPQYCLILNTNKVSPNLNCIPNTNIRVLDQNLYIFHLEDNPKIILLGDK